MKRIVVIAAVLSVCVALCVAARLFLVSQIPAQERRISDLRLQIEETKRRIPGIEAVRAKVANDQSLASQRMTAITSATLGRGKDKVAEVDAILADPELNRLALVYLGSDWAIMRSEFLGHIKHMREILTMREDERSKYKSEVERKIKELEAEKKRMSISMDRPNYNVGRYGRRYGDSGWFIRLRDVESQLNALRHIAYYGNLVNDDLEAKKLVEARTATEKNIFEMAMSYQANTVGVLNKTMVEQIAGLKREESEVHGRMASLQERVELLNNFRRVESWLDFWPLNTILSVQHAE